MESIFFSIQIGFNHQRISAFSKSSPTTILLSILITTQYTWRAKRKHGRIFTVLKTFFIEINGLIQIICTFQKSILFAYLLPVLVIMLFPQSTVRFVRQLLPVLFPHPEVSFTFHFSGSKVTFARTVQLTFLIGLFFFQLTVKLGVNLEEAILPPFFITSFRY